MHLPLQRLSPPASLVTFQWLTSLPPVTASEDLPPGALVSSSSLLDLGQEVGLGNKKDRNRVPVEVLVMEAFLASEGRPSVPVSEHDPDAPIRILLHVHVLDASEFTGGTTHLVLDVHEEGWVFL